MSVSADELLDDASVTYGDWVGTAAADKAHGGIEEVLAGLGLETDRWWVLSFDFRGADLNAGTVYVYALDRAESGVSNHAQLREYLAVHGEVPVTSFLVHDVPVAVMTKMLFKYFSVNLRARGLGADARVRVVHLDDLNYSDS